MKFQVIYADPPWPERATVGTPRFGADRHFTTMSEDQIGTLPVSSISDPESCMLFMWSTARHLPMAIRVMEAWRFTYLTVAFTWVKIARNGDPIYSQGFYTKPNAEFCLLGRRGRALNPEDKTVKSVVIEDKPEPAYMWQDRDRDGVYETLVGSPDSDFPHIVVMHPRSTFASKPRVFRERIKQMYPSATKIELFARQQHEDWTALGDGIDGQDISSTLQQLARRD